MSITNTPNPSIKLTFSLNIKIPAKIVKTIVIGCNCGIIYVASLYFNKYINANDEKKVAAAAKKRVIVSFLF